MNKNRRELRKSLKEQKQKKSLQKKLLYFAFTVTSIICLLIAHFDFDRFFGFFVVGLIGFSFTTATLFVELLECLLPSALVNNNLWTGEHASGRGLAGLIAGILAIAIAVGLPYLMMKMGASYIVYTSF